MIIVSDFKNTLEIDGKIDTQLFGYLLAMALNGHKVGIFSGNPAEARAALQALAQDKDAITPVIEAAIARNKSLAQDADCIRAEILVGDLIHIDDKPNLGAWLKSHGARKADIGFDDDLTGSPISLLTCTSFIDRHSSGYDSFIYLAQSRGPETASGIITRFAGMMQDDPAPAPF